MEFTSESILEYLDRKSGLDSASVNVGKADDIPVNATGGARGDSSANQDAGQGAPAPVVEIPETAEATREAQADSTRPKGKPRSAPRREPKAYPIDMQGDTDPRLRPDDMLVLVKAEINQNGIAGHHIDSMNSFYQIGIKQIATKVFTIEGRMRNKRDKTDEDKEIVDISYKVEFTDINLTPPTNTRYKSGRSQMLTPNMARMQGLTYSGQMYVDAEIAATAHYKNGTSKTRRESIKGHRIASIPCLVRSSLCNTHNCSRETLKELEEDPNDPGGYFIVKGGEWAIDNLENITNNSFHVYKKMRPNEVVRGTFLSKPGDAYENSYQVIIRYTVQGAINIEITTNKSEKFEVPYYLLFRALGVTVDRDIINHIVYGVENTDAVTMYMMKILEKAFDVDDLKFGNLRKSTNQVEIIQALAYRLTELANPTMARKDENVNKYINNNILNIIDRNIFPHIGGGEEHRVRKLRFLGHLINELLSVDMGIMDPTDRDAYRNKRIHSGGVSLAKAFKTDFNFAIVQEIRKQFVKDFTSSPFSAIQLAESFKSAIKSDDLERMLTQAITTGNKTITVKRTEIVNRISSQTLYRKNDLNMKSTLRNVSTLNQMKNSSKQNERADEMRRVHPTSAMFIDCSQSPDTGEKVGVNKQFGITTSVCGATSSYLLKAALLENPSIIPLDDVQPEDINSRRLAKVFVNGDWIGCCERAHEIVQYYRMARRHEDIHYMTSIVWGLLTRRVYFWTDVGRLLIPLIIVYNNLAEYVDNWRNGDRTVQFRQWTRLTREHILGLRDGKLTMHDLRRERIIEYISPEEFENTYVAENVDVLRANANNVQYRFTHCGIDQAILGIVTLGAPMCTHSLTARNTMFTNHRKQSAGWFALNAPYRIDKGTTFQHYCERPIVSCFTDTITYPNGQNAIVALALYGGQNTEDSILVNQSSVDRGLFNASHYNYEKAELDKNEQFGNPDFGRTMDIKQGAIYEHTVDGFIKEGTEIHKDYVLIVKARKLAKPIGDYTHVDQSITYRSEQPAFVERVITPRNDENVVTGRVKWRTDRSIIVGDKLCLSEDHDILTKRGWIPVKDVKLTDEVACLWEGGYLGYDHPIAVHQYDHDGEMYEIKTTMVNQCVTLNHRMYVKTRRGKEHKLLYARDIIGKTYQYKRNAENVYLDQPTIALTARDSTVRFNMDAWLKLLGIFISDGNSHPRVYGITVISAAKLRKINNLIEACRLLNVELRTYGDTHHIRSAHVYEALAPLSLGAAYKYLPEYVWDLSERQARVLIDGLIGGDGHVDKKGNMNYFTSSKRLADDVQRLALHAGMSSNIVMCKPAGTEAVKKDGEVIKTNYDHYKVSIVRSRNEPRVNEYCKENGTIDDRVLQYKGKVYCITLPAEVFYVRRGGIPSWTGNSSLSGNKGIVAKLVAEVDMPYTEDGIRPDLVVNSHSIPTRMAINQILQCMYAQLAAARGSFIDATAFKRLDIDAAFAELEKHGVKYGGHKRMYNGKTGDWLDTLIFIGPTTYQRLEKFVIDEHYATRTGPTAALSRQPLDGKNNEGGLRIGEMEAWVLNAAGSAQLLAEKFYRDSDGQKLYICRKCQNRAVVNEKLTIYKCKYCGDDADIAAVDSSWVANVIFSELSTMNVKMNFELEPYTYAVAQKDAAKQ